MSIDEDPPRLADSGDDGAGGQLSRLVRGTRGAGPSPAARRRMWAGVGGALGGAASGAAAKAAGSASSTAAPGAAATGATTATTGATAAAGATVKLIAVLVASTAAVGGGLAWHHAGRAHEADAARMRPGAVTALEGAQPRVVPEPVSAPPEAPRVDVPASSAAASSARQAETPVESSAPHATSRPRGGVRPTRNEREGAAARLSAPLPAGALEPSVAAAPPAPLRQAAPAAEPSPLEAQLLLAAQTALSSSPERALDLCAEHARRFPHGPLAEEREPIAIEALARLGRVAEARARAKRFLDAYPRSVHALRVNRLLDEADH